jgi:hypothetical protein
MALVFLEGFDGALSNTQLLKKWGTFTSVTLQASGRNGGGNAFWGFGTQAEHPIQPTKTCIVGLAVNPLGPLTGIINLIEWGDPQSSVQCRLRINTNGTIEVLRSGITTLGTSVATIITDAYTYLEAKLFCHNSLGTCEVRLDNAVVLTIGPTDTQGSGVSSDIVSVDFGGNTGAGVRVDDLYIADDSGSINNDFLGDCRVDTLAPTTDAVAEFDTATPSANHFENVDDEPIDEDTSYNETPTNGDREIYARSTLPVHPLPSVVLAVQPWAYIKKQNDSGDVLVRQLVQPITTIYNQTSQGPSAENWMVLHDNQEILELNPETGLQWLESEVNASKFGVEVI